MKNCLNEKIDSPFNYFPIFVLNFRSKCVMTAPVISLKWFKKKPFSVVHQKIIASNARHWLFVRIRSNLIINSKSVCRGEDHNHSKDKNRILISHIGPISLSNSFLVMHRKKKKYTSFRRKMKIFKNWFVIWNLFGKCVPIR